MALYDSNGNVLSVGGGGASPIAGKKIAMIGDSNTAYNADSFKAYMEETYGCSFTPLGSAGSTWEVPSGYPATDVNKSAVGRVNSIVYNVDDNNLITQYDCIVIMMGTNMGSLGTPEDTSDNVSTMCGAMRYCMEKLCYYGRQIPIGVIIPIPTSESDVSTLPTKFQYIEQIATEFAVPVLNMYNEGRIIPNSMTPDGNTYYLGDSVHLGSYGVAQFNRIMGKWIAYQL